MKRITSRKINEVWKIVEDTAAAVGALGSEEKIYQILESMALGTVTFYDARVELSLYGIPVLELLEEKAIFGSGSDSISASFVFDPLIDAMEERYSKSTEETPEHDPVHSPEHYTSDPSGVECIDITRHRNFNIGNAFKYLWRAGRKDGATDIEDLRKAVWYIEDEITTLDLTAEGYYG